MTRDQFLTEKMGECWHNFIGWINHAETLHCEKCGVMYSILRQNHSENNFSTWEGFGKLWEWAKEQEWWLDFTEKEAGYTGIGGLVDTDLVNPDRFADAISKYLGWEEK